MTRVTAALRIAALVLVSMGAGAAAVASAYQAQDNQRRDEVATGVELRAALARQLLVVAAERLKAARQQVDLGMASPIAVLEGQLKVTEAEADLRRIQLQLDEIRLTSREPRTDLSSPLVSGRDFVVERLLVDLSVAEKALALERDRLQRAQQRFETGLANNLEVGVARIRAIEATSALEGIRATLDLRRRFLSGAIDAPEAELRRVENEAEQRRKALVPKVDVARKTAADIAAKVEIGTAPRVELAEATLRRLELETELSKVDLELALIRRQIEQHRARR